MPLAFFLNKSRLILALFVILAFGSTLKHDFVGDDEIVIVHNAFYESPKNLKRLFDRSYLTISNDIFLKPEKGDSSGSVAYRPVLSLTYFLDHAIWKKNPFGYHLTNLLLHLWNVLLLFQIVNLLTKKENIAFWGAALFSIHPIQSEAVVNIGYRGDIIATFFFFLAFYHYCLFRQTPENTKRMILTLLFSALAYFSKESAIVLIPTFLLHEILQDPKPQVPFKNHRVILTIGMASLITIGYLYTYFFIFPNTTLDQWPIAEEGLIHKIMISLWTLTFYLKDVVLPLTVSPVPNFFQHTFSHQLILEALISLSVFVFYGFVVIKFLTKEKPAAFFGIWFLLAYIPASPLLPNVNPTAHRFLYLPMAGLMPFMVYVFLSVFKKIPASQNVFYPKLAKCILISVLLISTIYVNSLWSHEFIVAKNWIQNYPKHASGYRVAGTEHYLSSDCQSAMPYLQKARELGDETPQLTTMLAECSFDDFNTAKSYLAEAISLYPDYAMAHYLLGKLYYRTALYAEALDPLLKSLDLGAPVDAVVFAMEAYKKLGKTELAEKVLTTAKTHLNKEQLLDLEILLKTAGQSQANE